MYVLGPCGSPRTSPVKLGVSPAAASTPTGVSVSCLRLHFPTLELWVAQPVTRSTSCYLAGQLQLCPVDSTICHLAGSASCHLTASPLRPGCPSLPLLPVWMDVSFVAPWLLDFHTVCFSVSFGCFLFLNLLLSLFWLCEEAQYIYLCLYLGRKSFFFFYIKRSSVLDLACWA